MNYNPDNETAFEAQCAQLDNEKSERMYRYEDRIYASCDEFDNVRFSPVAVELHEFRVLRRTAKGAWIDAHGRDRFVLSIARKRYACSTIEEARASFVARKKRQLGIYEARARRARDALHAMERLNAREEAA